MFGKSGGGTGIKTTIKGNPCHWVDETGVHHMAKMVELDTQTRVATVTVEDVKKEAAAEGKAPGQWHWSILDYP